MGIGNNREVAAWTTHTTSHGLGIGISDYERNFLMKIHESDFNTGSVYHIGGSNENTVQYTFKNSRGALQGYSAGRNFHDSHGPFVPVKIDNVPGSITDKRFSGTFSSTL